jgi:hypothetical protein
MKLPIMVHRAGLGGEEFRVIRPARTLPNAVLLDHDRWLDMYVDETAAAAIGGLWLLAARSSRSLIHLPLRGNIWPFEATGAGFGAKLDLVLLHHSLQFPPSRWKELRRALDAGRPTTASVPEAGQPVDPPTGSRHHRENRDLFRQHLHAETLFMTGSADLFRVTAGHFLEVARHGPGFAESGSRAAHYCERFHSGDGVLGVAREIHVEYVTPWR